MSYRHVTIFCVSGTGNSFRAASWLREASEQRDAAARVVPVDKTNPKELLHPGPEQLVGLVLVAILIAYYVFFGLLKIRPLRLLFTYPTFTKLHRRRYHEPETRVRDLLR